MDFKQQLVERAETDSMACIGCNDCMLACPLPETQIVTIAELNAAVGQTVISNPNVIEFVTACTQCRQCVPACPADLSRADMVLFNKMKVEDATPNQSMNLQVGNFVQPSGWTVDEMGKYIQQIPIFRQVEQADLRRTLLKSTLRQLAPNEILCREGSFHERLYIILDGNLEQIAQLEDGSETLILEMGAGSFYGEMAVMTNQPELYTVRALVQALVLEIPKAALYRLMELSMPFKQLMDSIYEQRAVWSYAQKSPVLKPLSEKQMEELLQAADLHFYLAGDEVIREGEMSEYLYLVRTGFLRVSRHAGGDDRVLLYFREGDLFGGVALLLNEANQFSVTANTRSELIRIPGKKLNEILAKQPQIKRQLLGEAMKVEEVARSTKLMPQKEVKQAANATHLELSWTSLLDQGVIQGNEVLVIDQEICTNCNNCVDSCARRHGYSRLERRGIQLDNLLFPTACRHCEDPKCLLCSVNGIVRLPDGEITIVEDSCIGCGACAQRCPYGNIRMHDVADKYEPKNFLLQLYDSVQQYSHQMAWTEKIPEVKIGGFDLFDLLRGGKVREEALSELEPQRIAVKCDLCAGHNDYACVTACPVGAAFRIDPMEAFNRDDMVLGLEMKK